ncbi:MAG: proton-conducting transporter membrane subunit [Candidatus Micrarchaeota archaeon]|nr:proton-conducting transporter membrane subunit [Candidatus Micrarchaeota archaeon]
MIDLLPPVVPIGIYLLGAFLIPVISKFYKRAVWAWSLLVSLAVFASVILLYPGPGQVYYYWLGDWVPQATVYGIALALDSLNWLFLFLLAMFTPLAIIYSKPYVKEHTSKYYALLLLLSHTWMPEAYSSAPSPVSMLLIGVKYGAGLYVLLRILSVIFGFVGTSWLLILIGLVTMVVGVTMAMVQVDFKRMLSYHAISQLGYMVLAFGLGTPLGLVGCLFHVFNHVIYKGMLFLTAGSVYHRTGTLDVNRMGGLAKVMPFTALAFAIGALSISGVPPFNGFASKWVIYNATFQVNPLLTAISLLVSALTLASYVKVFHAVCLGTGQATAGIREVPLPMLLPMLLLALACVLVGLFPEIIITYVVGPAAQALASPLSYISPVIP